jgi:hypothetical protein
VCPTKTAKPPSASMSTSSPVNQISLPISGLVLLHFHHKTSRHEKQANFLYQTRYSVAKQQLGSIIRAALACLAYIIRDYYVLPSMRFDPKR